MSQPTPYTRKFSFTNDQTANPSTKTPGNQLDIEYNAILLTLNQALANLALIQRDDGKLATGSVGVDQLDPVLSTGVTPAVIWQSPGNFPKGSTVFFGSNLYRCLVSHISGVFATDLASGFWLLIANFSAVDLSSPAAALAQSGTGALTRSLRTILSEFPTSTDWDTGAHALAQAQGLLWVPNGAAKLPALPFTTGSFPNTAQLYIGPTIDWNSGAPLGTGENAHLMLSVQHAGAHPGTNDSSLAIVTSPIGNGGTGGSGDISLTISNIKQNFQTTTTTGDLSGINIVMRNGGSDTGRSDTAALNLDISSVGTTGQLFAFEAATKNFNRSGTQLWGVDCQVATIDAIGGHLWGYVANIDTGVGDAAFLAQTGGVSSWSKVLSYITVAGGNRFSIEGNASIKMYPTDGTNTDFITLQNSHSTLGKFRVLNTSGVEIFSVDGSTSQARTASFAGTGLWTFDATGALTATVANGASAVLPVGRGFIYVEESSAHNAQMYVMGAGSANLVATASVGGIFVASTTTPVAGHASVAFNGANYAIYNNIGSTVTFTVAGFRIGASA